MVKDYSIENLKVATEEEVRAINQKYKCKIQNKALIQEFLFKNELIQQQAFEENFIPQPYLEEYNLELKWIDLTNVITSAVFKNRVGRQMKFLVKDRKYGFIYGLVQMSSPIQNRKVGEYFLEKTGEKLRFKHLNASFLEMSTCIGTGILTKYLSGKMQVYLSCSQDMKDIWDKKYNTDIKYVMTTSLYGKSSIYNRLPFFTYLGLSAGYNSLFSKEQVNWIKTKYKEIFPHRIKTKQAKAIHLMRHYEHLYRYYKGEMPFYPLKTQRGVYLFDGTNGFKSATNMIDIWKNRWYIPRKERMKIK